MRPPDPGPLARSALGGTLAVGLVAGGIVALQTFVPEPPRRGDGPVVKGPTETTFRVPRSSETPPLVQTSTAPVAPVAPASPTSVPSPAPSTPSPTAAAERPALTVLNNSRVTGLAARAARDFEAGGWDVAATGNLRGRTPRTTVYYAPGYADEAAELRRRFPKVLDALPRPNGVPGGTPLTVVVTRDYAA